MTSSVLVVDDEVALAWGVCAVLQEEGYLVATAEDGREALERLVRQRPDLILLDLMMPGMSGAELLEVLSRDLALRDIPVVLMTGLSVAALERVGLAQGRPVLKKPFTADQLLQVVRAIVGEPPEPV
jgi:CheY-like chemotaxis protein